MKEAEEQALLFQWAAAMRRRMPEMELLFHIPNGGSRNMIEARHLKAQGVKPGVPDLFLPVARHGMNGLFIEMKRADGGRLSDEQKTWIQRLRQELYEVKVCHGFDEARKALEEYLTE